ncbi:MAG: secretion protein [Bacteroidetes bacterium HGW-Bacteroidetes-12]|nr:MAG: secretion protein [Bacteroidetes bacterium HGW-Bacteroidetes-12]
MKNYSYLLISFLICNFQLMAQGPFAPAANQTGSTAIHKDSTVFVGWATSAVIDRGWQDISNTALGKTTVGNDTSATEKAGVNGIVSLGDGGSAILTFATPIMNGQGADFAVFENAFNATFLELAFVEVSSDGSNFFRFDAISLTQDTLQLDNNATIDATNINNLAGKYQAQYGTPFDLDELSGISGLDINNITHVKIIDVVGSINATFGTFDSQSNKINDPFPTPFPSGGFDLDAVGVIHSLSTSVSENSNVVQQIYPNPIVNEVTVQLNQLENYFYSINDISGKTLINGQSNDFQLTINVSSLNKGIYFLTIITTNNQKSIHKIVKQ